MFVYYQMPRYGYHSGVWNGHRYYRTEYNLSGEGNPIWDATDNIQALAAQILAKIGYHTGDRRYLEFARGLLWYVVREFTTDGRFYYGGAENPMNARRSESHEEWTLQYAMGALPYLIAAGVDVALEMKKMERAWDWYRNHFPAYASIRDGRAYKVLGEVLEPGVGIGNRYIPLSATVRPMGDSFQWAVTDENFLSLPARPHFPIEGEGNGTLTLVDQPVQ